MLDELLLSARQIKLLHLVLQDVPRLFTIVFFFLEFLVFTLDISFR